MFPEPHSTKQIEDAVAYGLDGSAELLVMDDADRSLRTARRSRRSARACAVPVLVVHGDRDNCQPFERGLAFAELTGAEHVHLVGSGHIPNARNPVLINRLMHEFAARFAPPAPRRRSWRLAGERPRRALLASSPIGLGHAWRDVAIARELRRLVPGLEVHWLAQPPVTTLLEACGELVHPASADLAPEAAGVDGEAGEHALHAFQMLRRLDEIFCANFMVFHDLVAQEAFDVWIADEAWEVDYFLHENPELKTAPYVWLTDFVGVLPMPEGGEREAFLAADTNRQMVEHVARNPRLRDRSIFVGDPDDIVPERLAPELPAIRDWTEPRFAFSGYITASTRPSSPIAMRSAREVGFRPGEQVCVVAAGGSAAGVHLLQRAAAAFPEAKCRVPELRMILVGGPADRCRRAADRRRARDPRLHPRALPAARRLRPGDHPRRSLHDHGADRERAAVPLLPARPALRAEPPCRPPARPPRSGPADELRGPTGRRRSRPAIAEEIGRAPQYRPVEQHGAARAAQLIGEVLSR